MAKRKDDVAESGEDSTSIKAKRVKTDKPHGLETPNSTARREKLVKDTNALTGEQFEARFVDEDMLSYVAPGKDAQEAFDISLVAADWLTPGEHNASYGIVEETSRPDYESSTFGWHPRRKRKEMLEPEMKYFFVRRKGAKPTIERTKSGDLDTSILGFLSCMVTHDSSPSVPVLYIYEIHLKETLRGLGLGKHLMRIADQLAENVGLEKVMLTCFSVQREGAPILQHAWLRQGRLFARGSQDAEQAGSCGLYYYEQGFASQLYKTIAGRG